MRTASTAVPEEDEYYQCPDCGYAQKSRAMERIRCHRCDRSYLRRDAKVVDKRPDDEAGTDFFRYTRNDERS